MTLDYALHAAARIFGLLSGFGAALLIVAALGYLESWRGNS